MAASRIRTIARRALIVLTAIVAALASMALFPTGTLSSEYSRFHLLPIPVLIIVFLAVQAFRIDSAQVPPLLRKTLLASGVVVGGGLWFLLMYELQPTASGVSMRPLPVESTYALFGVQLVDILALAYIVAAIAYAARGRPRSLLAVLIAIIVLHSIIMAMPTDPLRPCLLTGKMYTWKDCTCWGIEKYEHWVLHPNSVCLGVRTHCVGLNESRTREGDWDWRVSPGLVPVGCR